jgi:short-subunit dehydrogenase
MSNTYLSIGAGPGIGLSTARRFAAEGFDIVLAARNADSLDRIAQSIRTDFNVSVETERLDVRDTAQITACIERHADRLHVLHYNAARTQPQSFLEQTSVSIQEDVVIDFSGALVAVQNAVSIMAPRRQGTILITGGGLALHPHQDYLTLGASKAGLRNAVLALFPMLAQHGLHIAMLTIHSHIAAGSAEADAVGEEFWSLFASAPEQWVWERNYPR